MGALLSAIVRSARANSIPRRSCGQAVYVAGVATYDVQAMPTSEVLRRQRALARHRADLVYEAEGTRVGTHMLEAVGRCVRQLHSSAARNTSWHALLCASSSSSKLEDVDGPRRTRNQPGRGRRLGATTAAPPSTSPTARACGARLHYQHGDGRALEGLLQRARTEEAHSEEEVVGAEQLLMLTKVCAETGGEGWLPPMASWFRYRSPHNHTQPAIARAVCETKVAYGRASKTDVYEVAAGGGTWIHGRRERAAGYVLRCSGEAVDGDVPHRHRLVRHTYCSAPPARRFEAADAANTTWLRGVTLVATERHAHNLNHLNRDVLFFLHVCLPPSTPQSSPPTVLPCSFVCRMVPTTVNIGGCRRRCWRARGSCRRGCTSRTASPGRTGPPSICRRRCPAR